MTTRHRLDLLARAYPQLFPRAELRRLVVAQLGHVDALDSWIARDGVRTRARAPKLIHHICAGNLAISAIASIAHGLILGSMNTVKLPGTREDNATRREITAFVRGLPRELGSLVRLQSSRDTSALVEAEVIVAFGNSATMEALRMQVRGEQRFIAHGHAVSFLWIEKPRAMTSRTARACAIDVLTYDQLGCLSPQAIYVASGTIVEALGGKLAQALEAEWRRARSRPARTLGARARIAEARDVASALGHRMWLPPARHQGWTLIHDPDATFAPSPLHGVIHLRVSSLDKLATHLGPARDKISTIGVPDGKISNRARDIFLHLGATRFCAAGRMQFPPLGWHHDGRETLRDLVTWIDAEM